MSSLSPVFNGTVNRSRGKDLSFLLWLCAAWSCENDVPFWMWLCAVVSNSGTVNQSHGKYNCMAICRLQDGTVKIVDIIKCIFYYK